MLKKFGVFTVLSIFALNLAGAEPAVEWAQATCWPNIFPASAGEAHLVWERILAHRYGFGLQYPNAVAVDRNGNVIITGKVSRFPFGFDFVIIKYDPSGKMLWKTFYDGPAHAWDEPSTLYLDVSGNIYVTGRSYGTDNSSDFVTIKYAPDGRQLWVARYSPPRRSQDHPTSMSMDADGCIYVTGTTYKDAVTLKYDPDGNLVWVAKYEHTSRYRYWASSVRVSPKGLLHVVMCREFDWASPRRASVLIVTYDTDGREKWSRIFGGKPGEADTPAGFALDREGNLLIKVNHQETLNEPIMLKYSADGDSIWAYQYDTDKEHWNSFSLDSLGNIYIAGWVTTRRHGDDFLTIKINPQGQILWKASYDGSSHVRDWALRVRAIGAEGAIVAGWTTGRNTGLDFTTIRYDSAGNIIWTARYDDPEHGYDGAHAMTVGPSGEIVVIGVSDTTSQELNEQTRAITTVKYDRDGRQQWVNRYCAPSPSKLEPGGLVSDSNGNVYVASKCRSSRGVGLGISKFNPAGSEEWNVEYSDFPGGVIAVLDTKLDSRGNVLTAVTTGLYGGAVLKYTEAGSLLWKAPAAPSEGHNAIPRGFALDPTDHIYVAGEVKRSGTGWDTYVVKLNPEGRRVWDAYYDGGFQAGEMVAAVEVDSEGNVYVAGNSWRDGTGRDLLVVKFDPIGRLGWSTWYNEPGQVWDNGGTIVLDDSANSYVVGVSHSPARGNCYILAVKFDRNGDLRWVWRYGNDKRGDHLPIETALDPGGNVVILARSYSGYATHEDFLVAKLNRAGQLLWVTTKDGPLRKNDDPTDLLLSPCGDIYVAGGTPAATGGRQALVAKFNSEGKEQWTLLSSGLGTVTDFVGLAPAPGGGFFLASSLSATSGPSTFGVLARYDEGASAVADGNLTSKLPESFKLLRAYPNPFNESTVLTYEVPRRTHVELFICDLRGRRVATLVDERSEPGTHQVRWRPEHLASGLYLCVLRAGQVVQAQKLTVLK